MLDELIVWILKLMRADTNMNEKQKRLMDSRVLENNVREKKENG